VSDLVLLVVRSAEGCLLLWPGSPLWAVTRPGAAALTVRQLTDVSAVPPSGAGPPAAVLGHATGGRLPDDLRSVG
jgi:hypothetical protein